jgi:S1-C subfamily serine protease
MMREAVLAAAAVLILGVSGPAMAQRGAPASFADLAEQLSPAVVNISTAQRGPGGAATGELAAARRSAPVSSSTPQASSSPTITSSTTPRKSR